MTDPTPHSERELIGSGQDDAQVADVLVGHDQAPNDPHAGRPPIRWFSVDRRVAIAAAVCGACFSAAVLILSITAVTVIHGQSTTIDSERAARTQAEARVASLQSQVSDQQNQTLCRAQVANDYESASTRHSLDSDARQSYFFEALNAVAARDEAALADALAKANQSEAVVEASGQAQSAAAQARQESVAACQKASATSTSQPGG